MEINKKSKNPVIEIIQFIAACGIVCFHTHAPWTVYISTLPIFVIISISFIVNSQLSFSAQLKKSFKRLIQPWIFWSVIFGIGLIIKAIITGVPISSKFHWLMLISGTSIPLWYLPFIFVSIIIVFFIVKHFNLKLNYKIGYVTAILGGLILIIVSILLLKLKSYYPFAQWLTITPAIIIGFIFSSFYYKLSELIFNYGLWFVIICCIVTIMIDMRLGISYLTAVCLFSFAFSYKPPQPNNFINYLGKISYGIYLVHGLFISFWISIGIDPKSLWLTFLTLISSIIFTSLLEKTVIKRFI